MRCTRARVGASMRRAQNRYARVSMASLRTFRRIRSLAVFAWLAGCADKEVPPAIEEVAPAPEAAAVTLDLWSGVPPLQ